MNMSLPNLLRALADLVAAGVRLKYSDARVLREAAAKLEEPPDLSVLIATLDRNWAAGETL